jgi:hypothetical protein
MTGVLSFPGPPVPAQLVLLLCRRSLARTRLSIVRAGSGAIVGSGGHEVGGEAAAR